MVIGQKGNKRLRFRLAVADARVKQAVHKINHQVGQQHDHGYEHDD